MLIYPPLVTQEVLWQHRKIPDEKIIEDMADLKRDVLEKLHIVEEWESYLREDFHPDICVTIVSRRCRDIKSEIAQKIGLYVFLEKLSVARQSLRN